MITFLKGNFIFCQDLDVDETLERLDRLEKNVSDLQKGKFDELDKSLSSGYISRNESRLDEIETKSRTNYGVLEEIQNKLTNINEKLELINSDFQSRILKIEEELVKIKNLNDTRKNTKINKNESIRKVEERVFEKNQIQPPLELKKENKESLTESEIKKKYENAIKLLWASKFQEAENELNSLKKSNPEDLMPNIQYWLGEIHYAQKNFEKAIVEFGEGLKKYPDSIKGPDNMLKLALSFSNLERKDDACNVLYELQIKYKNAPKNVLERSLTERKKLDCPKE
ncbi:MAG: hypothetical protein CMM95_01705 [Rickettsiales bacterium]|nr:hypothetical protein [Rickettsiales bacterium]